MNTSSLGERSVESRAYDQGASPSGRQRQLEILFLAHSFPPALSSGAVRTWSLAKYLSREGLGVTVVTPDPRLWRRRGTGPEFESSLRGEGVTRVSTSHHYLFLSPERFSNVPESGPVWALQGLVRRALRHKVTDSSIGWMRPALAACRRFRIGEFDLVLASGQPFSSFPVAREVARHLKCPYVLDYRDPWSGNPHVSRFNRFKVFKQEAPIIEGAAAVVTVSPSWAQEMESRFNLVGRVHIIPNGYDPDETAGVKPVDLGDSTVLYAGSLYPPKRTLIPVFDALSRIRLGVGTREWKFHYFGEASGRVLSEAGRFGLVDRVICHGNRTRAEVLSAEAGAKVNVVVSVACDFADVADKGIIPGKIFELIGLGKPVLLIAPDGCDVCLVGQAGSQVTRCRGGDVEGIASYLEQMLKVEPMKGTPDGSFQWPKLAREYSEVLRAALNKPACSRSAPPNRYL